MENTSHKQKLIWMQAIGAGIGLIFASLRLPGGDDLYRYYIPFAQGCLDCGYIPYYGKWFLWPMILLPGYPYAWFVWTIICVLSFMVLAHHTEVNPFWLMISFPMLGQIWLGQIDVLICLGLVVLLRVKNPYWCGVGIILALMKPQLTVLPVFLLILLERPRTWVKLLIVPVLVVIASFFVYGLEWPIAWVNNALADLPVHVWRLASIDVWRFGIFLIPVPLLFRASRKRLLAGLYVSSLATPFYGVYSYVIFLLFETKGWSVVLSYGWLLGFLMWRETAMRFAWILPLGMLIYLLYSEWRERESSRKIVGSDP